jgi:histidinol-phosphatase
MIDLAHALQVAKAAANAAAVVIRRYYRRDAEVTLKADQSPVTRADIEAELEIKRVLKQAFPEHGYYGEESAIERLDAQYLWLIDPIDGTKSFVRNYPIFSTQIALMHRGELVLGVSFASEFGELAYATKGGGAFLNDAPISAAHVSELSQAIVSTGNIKTLSRGPGWQALATVLQAANRTRGYGDFYHYHLLAQGSLDLVIESDVNILDIAALCVIVREAGAVITDLAGAPIGLATTSVLAGSAALHAQTLARLIPALPARIDVALADKAVPTIEARENFTRESSMERVHLRFSNGAKREFYRVLPNAHQAVMVIAMLDAHTVLITREYACGFHRYELGLPRGRVDEGEEILAAAQRELQEEAGYGARKLDYLRTLALAPTYFAQEIHLVLARDLYPSRLEGDEPEAIDVLSWPLAEIEQLALRGDFSEGRALGALLVARAWLQVNA